MPKWPPTVAFSRRNVSIGCRGGGIKAAQLWSGQGAVSNQKKLGNLEGLLTLWAYHASIAFKPVSFLKVIKDEDAEVYFAIC